MDLPSSSRILEVDMGTGNEDWEVVGRNILAIYGRRGGVTGGYEKIVFSIGEELVYDHIAKTDNMHYTASNSNRRNVPLT